MAIIIQNVSGVELDIDDLGVTLEIGEIINLATRFSPLDIATTMEDGEELYTLISIGSIVVKDPANNLLDLSPAEGVENLQTANSTPWRITGGGRAQDISFVPVSDNQQTNVQSAIADNSGKVEWKGAWVAGQYDKHDLVRDGAWTMVANKQTTQRAAPIPDGPSESLLPESPTWLNSNDISVIQAKHVYTFAEGGWIPALRIWPDALSPAYKYRIRVLDITGGSFFGARDIPLNVASLVQGQWNDIPTNNQIVLAGSIISVELLVLNLATTINFSGDWTFDSQSGGNSPPSSPAESGWSTNGHLSKLKVDKDDITLTDRTAELLSVKPETEIHIFETADATKSVTLRVDTAPVNAGNYIEYVTTLVGVGPGGEPTIGETATLDFTVPVPAGADYVEISNIWNQPLPDYLTSVTSSIEYNGIDQAASINTAYGVDFDFQRALIPTDWDLIAATLDLIGGGGGTGTDELVKVSSNDTTGDYLDAKLVAGTGITLVENDDGANETLTIAASGGGTTIGISDEGVLVPNSPFAVIDFVGAGVTATDGGAGEATVTIPGGPDITGTELVTGDWTFNPNGTGGLTDYDIVIGGTEYAMIDFGAATLGRTSYNVGNLDLDGSLLLWNTVPPGTSNIEFAFADGSNMIRFAIAEAGVGNATYSPRSMLIAGPAVLDDLIVTVGYWQGQGIFDNLVCDTDTSGADLGVQNDLEVEGDIFTDSIKGSTDNTTITIQPNGTGNVSLGNFVFDVDQTVGAGQDTYVLTYDDGTGFVSLEAAVGGSGGLFEDSTGGSVPGTRNIRGGSLAGNALATGSEDNFLAGDNAGKLITTSDRNILIGTGAGESIVASSSGNVAIGVDSLKLKTIGQWNIAIGKGAMQNQASSGSSNIAIGVNSMRDAGLDGPGSGNANSVAVGNFALLNSGKTGGSEGTDNTAIGHAALNQLNNGPGNTAIGYRALDGLITGDYNIAIGWEAGRNQTSGDQNVFIGNNSGPTASDVDDELFIESGDDAHATLYADTPLIGGSFQQRYIQLHGTVFIQERSAAKTPDKAGYGQLWVRDDTPNTPMFTDDAGTDYVLNSAGGGSGPQGTAGDIQFNDGGVAGGDFAANNRLNFDDFTSATQPVLRVGDPTGGTGSTWPKIQFDGIPFSGNYNNRIEGLEAGAPRWILDYARGAASSILTLKAQGGGNEVLGLWAGSLGFSIVQSTTKIHVAGELKLDAAGQRAADQASMNIPEAITEPTPLQDGDIWRTDTDLFCRVDGVSESLIGGGGGGGGITTVQDEGIDISTAATLLNFAGSGVTVTEPGTAGEMLVTIPSGGTVWGDITGTLSDQTDLQAALDAAKEEEMFAQQVDFVTDDLIYRGEAAPGTATSSALWRIRKMVINSASMCDVSTTWADGDADFNNVWDNRAGLTYS